MPTPDPASPSARHPWSWRTEGADQLVTGTAVDVAGNSASASVTVSVSFGSTEPLTITATASPAPNAAGWNNTAVTVTFTCTGSRLAVCPARVVVSTDGAGQQVTGTATDTAGNTATATATVSIDTTAPTITATVTPAPNAAGWNNTAVTVTFTCSDPVSGVASCPSSVGVSSNGANRVVTRQASDRAGNSASASATVNVDRTAPTIGSVTVTPASIVTGQTITVTAPFSDAVSGVAGAEAFIGADPGKGAATPIALSGSQATGQLVAPSVAGTYQVRVRVRDAAGNWSAVSSKSIVVKAVPPPVVAPKLMVSTSSNRANPVPLQGANLDGTVYIYLDPGSVAGISQVEFTIIWSKWLKLSTVDKKVPYDLAGTDNRGNTIPVYTRLLPTGSYELKATIRTANGQKQTIDATFTIVRPSRTPCSITDAGVAHSGPDADRLRRPPIPLTAIRARCVRRRRLSRSRARPDVAVDGVDHLLGVRGATGATTANPSTPRWRASCWDRLRRRGHGEAAAGALEHRLHDLASKKKS